MLATAAASLSLTSATTAASVASCNLVEYPTDSVVTSSTKKSYSLMHPVVAAAAATDTSTLLPMLSVVRVASNQAQQQSNHSLSSVVHYLYALRNSDKTFLILNDGVSLSYKEFTDIVFKQAAALKKLGIQDGQRVAVRIAKSASSLALYMAVMAVDAVYIPINTDYKRREVRQILDDSQPNLYVFSVDDDDAAADEGIPIGLVLNEAYFNAVAETCQPLRNIAWARQPASAANGRPWLAAILYTSGTTGLPKGVMVTHGNLMSNAQALCTTWRMASSDVLLHMLPIHHAHGLFVATNTTVIRGGSMVFLQRFDALEALKWLPRCTMLMGVPTYYTRLLRQPTLTRELTRSVRLFISGSAPLLPRTWQLFKDRTGHEILERYGMTEGQMICSNPFEGPRKPGTVGKPLPGISVRIRNNILEYKGPNVFCGYLNMEAQTLQEFTRDGYFVSGDNACFDEDNFIRILGRQKDLIITGGINVYPKEVELLLDDIDGVAESAVIGCPHPDFGEAVVAVCVRDELLESNEIDEKMIIKRLKQEMAGYKVPKRVIFLDELPRNTMGKVLKSILRKEYRNLFEDLFD